MCGLCGIVDFNNSMERSIQEQQVSAMIQAQLQRGPDGTGLIGVAAAQFGFVRLAIRGLADGQQPIVDEATGVMMVCNGEIDNHQALRAWLMERGRTVQQSTDVAVIPALYLELGDAFVERLVGAFAIALWDPRQGKLLLARDRAGERPLFYSQQNGVVLFASQIAALTSTQTPFFPDVQAVQGYLLAGYFPETTSPFKEISKVKPGELISISAAGIETKRYWQWRPRIQTNLSLEMAVAQFDQVFKNAVWQQSEVDVDFGLFLSGGLDSSLIAAVTKKIRPKKRLLTFTLRFSESSYDEGAYATQVASQLGVDCLPVWVKPEDFPPTLADLVRQSGEPLADPAWVPAALLAKRAAEDIRVALVGEGADELFAGYPTYFGAGLAETYEKIPKPLRQLIRLGVEKWPVSDKKVTLSFLLKRFVSGEGLAAVARHRLWTASIPPQTLKRLGIPSASVEIPTPYDSLGLLDSIQSFDLENLLAESLLTKADRASMRSALELRAPFLDQAVMEFAATLPPQLRSKGLSTKVFLKKYAENYLPNAIIYRKKRGLSVPLSSWFRGPLAEWALTRLDSNRLALVGIQVESAVELFHEHQQRKADHARALWTLIVLSEWLEWAEPKQAEVQFNI